MSNGDEDTFQVSAHPFKRFFIDVLTRDPNVIDTFPEFVDNSLDGAIQMRGDEESLDGLHIEIEFDEDQIEIRDNCGGIAQELAEDYAFRFGRPDEIGEEFQSQIGEFGVGMKRSIFKLGRYFLLESNPMDGDRFIIEEDVNEWMEREEDDESERWTFTGERVDESDNRVELEEPGTRIVIENLEGEAADELQKPSFETELQEELVSDFRRFLGRNFRIILNDEPVGFVETELKKSGELDIAYREFTVDQDGSEVEVTITAGVGESDPEEAGWYIFCNGRLVLEGDQSPKTGWNSDDFPKPHNQFNRFRGFVNFKSDDIAALPWNTSKTAINADSGVYRYTLQKMISTGRPIIDFFNDVRQEQKELDLNEDESPPLEQTIKNAGSVTLDEVDTDEDRDFESPEPTESEGPSMTRIAFDREEEKIRDLKEHLGVTYAYEVGKRTFDYYYENVFEE